MTLWCTVGYEKVTLMYVGKFEFNDIIVYEKIILSGNGLLFYLIINTVSSKLNYNYLHIITSVNNNKL